MKNLIAFTFILFVLSISQKALCQDQTLATQHSSGQQAINLQTEEQLADLSRLEFAKLSKDDQMKVWNKISDEQKFGYWIEKLDVLKEQFQEDAVKLKFILAIEDHLSIQSFNNNKSEETEQFFSGLVDKAIKKWGLESDFVYHTVFSLDDYSPKN